MADNIPPPPPGFTLDAAGGVPPPPEGFTLDSAPEAPKGLMDKLGVPKSVSAIPGQVAGKVGELYQNAKTAIGFAKQIPDVITERNAEWAQETAQKHGASAPVAAAAATGMRMAPEVISAAMPPVGGGEGATVVGKGGKAIVDTAERIASRGEQAAATRAVEQAPLREIVKTARTSGYRLPPAEVGGPVGSTLQGFAGKIETEKTLSRLNSKITNRLAKQDIGLTGNQPLTEGNLSRLKKQAGEVYEQVKGVGPIKFDEQYAEELKGISRTTSQQETAFPKDFDERVTWEVDKFSKFTKPAATSKEMVEKIKRLRGKASRNMKSLSDADFELGRAQKKIADALENQIDRHLAETDPTLIAEFRAARTKLAKIYNVEDALTPGGNVVAAVLARQAKKGVPLTGGLKTIADTYAEFPHAMRAVEGLGGQSPFSRLDALVGGVEALAHPGAAASIAGAIVGRPIVRSAITSELGQRASITPDGPSLLSRAARQVADKGREPLTKQTLESLLEDMRGGR